MIPEREIRRILQAHHLYTWYRCPIPGAESRVNRYRLSTLGAIPGTLMQASKIVLAVYEIRFVRLAAFRAVNRGDFLSPSFEEIIEFNPHPFGRSVLLLTARSWA